MANSQTTSLREDSNRRMFVPTPTKRVPELVSALTERDQRSIRVSCGEFAYDPATDTPSSKPGRNLNQLDLEHLRRFHFFPPYLGDIAYVRCRAKIGFSGPCSPAG